MPKVIGIDLGTANSCVAVIDEQGEVVVIPDPDGNRTTPSVFAVNNNQQSKVGYHALKQADMNRLNTIFAVKRLIGRKFGSVEVQQFAERVPYKIIPASNGDAWFEINEEQMSPEQGSAIILGWMRHIAEEYFKEPINHAVITVPAHFNDSQRQATKDAGKIAGLQVLSIINEPTAAALAYGLDIANDKDYAAKSANQAKKGKADRTIAVFDLGSGTFDITILALRSGIFDVLATGGDTYLGGEDFDLAIVNHLLTEFRRTDGIDLSKDRSVLQRLKEAAKIAKQELSNAFSYEVHIPYICKSGGTGAPKDLRINLDRKTFEGIVTPLLQRLDGPCLRALADANLSTGEIDDVILVGGMTRMPGVKYRAQKIFGKPPNDSINPDEAVASGAAIQAALLQGILKGLQLADVTSLSLGLEVQGGKMVTLLPRNSKVPSSVTEIFTTSAPNQRSVSIHLLQGESSFVPENKSLGRFELTGIPKGPRGTPRIKVTLEVDNDGIVHLSANDLITGERKEIEIINSSGLSEDEINDMVNHTRRESASRARREKQRSLTAVDQTAEKADKLEGPAAEIERLQSQLRALVFATQFKLDMEGKRLRGARRTRLEDAVQAARGVLNTSSDPAQLRTTINSMSDIATELETFLEAA